VTAPESPSALLRRAADRLDELALAAAAGPWSADASIPYGHRVGTSGESDWVAWTGEHGEDRSADDARYIAAMHPPTGRAVAAMLRAAADDAEECDRQNARHPRRDGKTRVMYHPMTVAAIGAARNVLGEA
jgi:hypothetical protein